MKKLLLVLTAFALLASLASAGDVEACVNTAADCEDACCTQVGGTLSGEYCDAPNNMATQYNACQDACTRTALNCIAPNSGCTSQYNSCAQQCGNNDDCRSNCLNSGFDCATEAGGGGGGCCGGAFVLLFAGLGGLMLTRRF